MWTLFWIAASLMVSFILLIAHISYAIYEVRNRGHKFEALQIIFLSICIFIPIINLVIGLVLLLVIYFDLFEDKVNAYFTNLIKKDN